MSSTMTSGLLSQPALERWGHQIGQAAAPARQGGAGDADHADHVVDADDAVDAVDAVDSAVARLPLVLALRGPLGAGKSVLARAVARGAGVTGPMPSPTYNLLFRYAGRGGVEVYHLDLYRLDDPDDVWELGWDELAVGAQVVLIEWPERAESLLPPDRWDVGLEFADDEHRRLSVSRHGAAPALPALPGGGA
jgi:tRNA threonylcarbamoyl adenosine modification protein YjeE